MKIDFKRYEPKAIKVPPHELAASVDEIVALVGVNKQYNYGYWLRKVKASRMSFPDILGILKEARDLPGKYSQGGFITNKLTGKKKDIKPLK